jgi:hypothetical protein
MRIILAAFGEPRADCARAMRACPCLRGVWANADLDGYRRMLSGSCLHLAP